LSTKFRKRFAPPFHVSGHPSGFAITAYTISIHLQLNNTYTLMFRKYLCRVSGTRLAPIYCADVQCTVTVRITILRLENPVDLDSRAI